MLEHISGTRDVSAAAPCWRGGEPLFLGDYLLQEQLKLFIQLLLGQSARHPAEGSYRNLRLLLDGTFKHKQQ